MCSTCHDTGGITTEHSWGFVLNPCPNTDCKVNEIERDKSINHIEETLMRLNKKLGVKA